MIDAKQETTATIEITVTRADGTVEIYPPVELKPEDDD